MSCHCGLLYFLHIFACNFKCQGGLSLVMLVLIGKYATVDPGAELDAAHVLLFLISLTAFCTYTLFAYFLDTVFLCSVLSPT